MTNASQTITPEQMASFVRVGDVQFSPDGELVAFVAGEQFQTDSAAAKSQIWLVPAAGGPSRPFTAGTRTDDTPRWSPDGQTLAFRSDRGEAGHPQVFLIDRAGGEARQLTDLPGAISTLEWSPDGTRLAFLMTEPLSAEQQQQVAAKNDAIEVEKQHRWQHVWTVDPANGAVQQITSGDTQIWEFSWAPDGGFALLVGPEPYEWSWFVAQLAQVGPAGGAPEPLYHVPEKQFASPRVSPDGTQIAFLSCIWSDRGINGGDLLLVPASGGAARNLTAGYNGSIWWIQWVADGATLDFMAYEGGELAIGRIAVDSGARTIRWRGAVGVDESATSRYIARATSMIAVLREDSTHPLDVWIGDEDDKPQSPAASLQPPASFDWKRLTNLHPQTAELALGETRVLHWRSADGTEIQGQLVLPVGYAPGQRVPLITWVHGGPAWLFTHAFHGAGRYAQQLFAGAGYAVLLANPRGSAGWGVAFTEANIGDFGGCDYQDIIAGIDHVIALGIADAERLGIGGWSYGGYMSAWAITQTDRFKAAVIGAGITNWRSFHGIASIGTWDQISLRANPYASGGLYDQRSPLHYVEQTRTPALLIHGVEDTIVPVSQSYEFFRALKDHGVTTELVIYPREPHGFTERAHNLDRFRRFLAWFQRYL